MKGLRFSAAAAGLILALATTQSAVAQSSTQMPRSGQANPIANEGVIEDEAVDAIKEMSNFDDAQTLGLTSQGSTDVVTDGQRIQLDGVTTYKIRKPGFVIDYQSDIKSRRFIYDGKTFTVYSPMLGFYASTPAPATNRKCWTRSTTSWDQASAGRPLPLGRRLPCRPHPGVEVRL